MKNIQEGRKRIACHVSNLGLVHESLIEEVRGILLLYLFLVVLLIAFGLLLLHSCTRDVEAHLDQLIGARSSLPATVLRASSGLYVGTVRLVCGKREFNRHFILACEVGIGDLGVGDFESGSVLDTEGELGLGELGLAPVPSTDGMFAGLDIDAVPDLEGLAQSLEVLVQQTH
jgi:hypothetical protein